MPATIEQAQYAYMQELVKPLGIKLPARLPDLSSHTEDGVYDDFGAEVDRLLGTAHDEKLEGVIESSGVHLAVGSDLSVDRQRGDDDIPWDIDHTYGPRRLLGITPIVHLLGTGVNARIAQTVRLEATEGYDGIKDHYEDGDIVKRLKVKVRRAVFPQNPLIAALGLSLEADKGEFADLNNLDSGKEQAFVIGTRILKGIEPGMLTLLT